MGSRSDGRYGAASEAGTATEAVTVPSGNRPLAFPCFCYVRYTVSRSRGADVRRRPAKSQCSREANPSSHCPTGAPIRVRRHAAPGTIESFDRWATIPVWRAVPANIPLLGSLRSAPREETPQNGPPPRGAGLATLSAAAAASTWARFPFTGDAAFNSNSLRTPNPAPPRTRQLPEAEPLTSRRNCQA